MIDLSGKTAVVTGSSSGIGRAIAVKLAAAGADVIVHARSQQRQAEETAAEITALGRRSTVLVYDLADSANHELLVEQAWNWQGCVDIWVNNAGGDVLTGPRADDGFEQKLDYLWKVDVLATIRLGRLAGRRMQQQGEAEESEAHENESGRYVILNMGWDRAEDGMEGDSGEMFAAVKGAVMAFSKSLAKSLAPHVRVHCLAPGWIRTAWGNTTSAVWRRRAENESLLGRWGEPNDVAHAACFLASDAASFINGQVVTINGGFRPGRGSPES